MAQLKYPIGIQTFADIRNEGYLYADKTGYIHQLVSSGAKHVFLSRPRRFGKSLLLSTFQAYFEGRKELFDGLELGRLESEWESYPVLRFSFAAISAQDASLVIDSVNSMLEEYENFFGVEIHKEIKSFGTRFGLLIKNVAVKTGKKVVVLIDEYDKGIVDILQDEEKLRKNIELFRPFYAQLKDQDEHLRFAFLTGVSRFRNLTLFSSPNQLQDISMDARYAAICGLTSDELHTVFAEGIQRLAEEEGLTVKETKEELRLKYDGYRFTRANTLVYNPFSILNCLSQGRLSNYWLTSGGATRVFVDFLKNSDYDFVDIEERRVREELLGGPYSKEDPIPLLFQTGYLTIADYVRDRYRLRIPNGEVRSALVDELVPAYLGIATNKTDDLLDDIRMMCEEGNPEGLMQKMQQIISGIPHQTFRNNDVEHVYHLVISLICHMAGISARSEVSVAGGDIDMLIETREYVYVFEFKKDHSAKEALQQIDTKDYALPWKSDGRKVFKIGVEFSSATRNIKSWVIG